ncbi:MAG TPA: tRNA pseudouridine(38-40) synthase TruA [Abditibacteriaceae bacterium]|nr:tRNA pseudouridine(38-40) synthase TruA [Abditibacteriaceae bacterium]
MRYIACIVAYDGTEYAGFQRQQNGRSVQGELERALEVVLKHSAPIVMAGRTDRGVHATGQYCRFATTNPIPAERVPLALNRVLDQAVRVLSAREVSESFHPRYSARSRIYRYTIDNGPIINPLLRRVAGHVMQKLDVTAMREAAPVFLGEQDFKAWQSAGSPAGSTVRTVKRLTVQRRRAVFGSALIEIEIEADAFLYQMVRNIVGALIKVGEGRLTADGIKQLTAGRDRTQCPPPAPPQGLSLVQVKY